LRALRSAEPAEQRQRSGRRRPPVARAEQWPQAVLIRREPKRPENQQACGRCGPDRLGGHETTAPGQPPTSSRYGAIRRKKRSHGRPRIVLARPLLVAPDCPGASIPQIGSAAIEKHADGSRMGLRVGRARHGSRYDRIIAIPQPMAKGAGGPCYGSGTLGPGQGGAPGAMEGRTRLFAGNTHHRIEAMAAGHAVDFPSSSTSRLIPDGPA